MEGTQSRTDSRELTIRVWDRLGRPAIGESELRQDSRVSSRTVRPRRRRESCRHCARAGRCKAPSCAIPKSSSFDARWRETRIENDQEQFKGIEDFLAGKPLHLKKAESLIKKLEKLRRRAESSGDLKASKETREVAISGRANRRVTGERSKAKFDSTRRTS